jgi:hypothetical protein
MPLYNHGPSEDFHLFHREKRLLRGTLTLLATLFTLLILAFYAPRAETALAWASDLLSSLAA